jgi:UDP-MurNAc hydroxylase
MDSIEFINHASVLISDGKVSILTDPWYKGDVFNHGWKLIEEFSDNQINNILDKTDYIWISHEHPDHFSVSFYNEFRDQIINKKIKIIFQKTADSRVVSFLKNKNFEVIELDENEILEINESFKIQIFKVDFYDSALLVNLKNFKILNTNDCPFEKYSDLKSLSKKIGKVDLLLSQFSYAAWKGGRENIAWRKKASTEKLENLVKQSDFLKCKKIIPFASFIFFSNKENFYLNDSINTPMKVNEYFLNSSTKIFFMKPFEKQLVKNLKQSDESLKYWEDKFKNIEDYIPVGYEKSFSIEQLKEEFKLYKKKLIKKNNNIILNFLLLLKPFNIFSDIRIKIFDLDCIINYSLRTGITTTNTDEFEVSLHSNSLMFIFKNEFGFDTLTVNGNFDCNKNGFSKMVKSFAIGSLNAMGLGLSFSAILKPRLFLLLLSKLVRVENNLE